MELDLSQLPCQRPRERALVPKENVRIFADDARRLVLSETQDFGMILRYYPCLYKYMISKEIATARWRKSSHKAVTYMQS